VLLWAEVQPLSLQRKGFSPVCVRLAITIYYIWLQLPMSSYVMSSSQSSQHAEHARATAWTAGCCDVNGAGCRRLIGCADVSRMMVVLAASVSITDAVSILATYASVLMPVCLISFCLPVIAMCRWSVLSPRLFLYLFLKFVHVVVCVSVWVSSDWSLVPVGQLAPNIGAH
jgi:hypothetical protein